MSKTYSASGVSLERAYQVLSLIERETRSPISHFASLRRVDKNFREFAMSADGVGTKIELLRRLGLDKTSGWDCVAANANDLLCQGSRVLWFLDYFSQGKLDIKIFHQVLKGMKEALDTLGAELVGGETAELPGLFKKPYLYELAGFAIGVKSDVFNIGPGRVRSGDLIFGLYSNGPHANGYSLIRKKLPWEFITSRAKKILAPTVLYHPMVWPLTNKKELTQRLHAMANITGGGFYEKVSRALPYNLQAAIHLNKWVIPKIFSELIERTKIGPLEACNIWNMGIGFILIVDKKSANSFHSFFKKKACLIGEIISRPAGAPSVLVRF